MGIRQCLMNDSGSGPTSATWSRSTCIGRMPREIPPKARTPPDWSEAIWWKKRGKVKVPSEVHAVSPGAQE